MSRIDNVDARAVYAVGFVSVVLVFAAIIGIQTLYLRQADRAESKRSASLSLDADNLNAEQELQLQQEGWLDRDKGQVAIPIDRAMELVVQDLRSEQAGDAALAPEQASDD